MYSMDSLTEHLFGIDKMGYMEQIEFIDKLTKKEIN
jgi:hypothetical protein